MKWEKVKLGDIATFSNGINFNKTAYAKGIKLIGVSNFGDRFYPDYSQLQEVKKDIVRLEDCLRNGDIVFVRSNGNKELVGRCMLVKNPTERVTYSGFCIRARLNDTDRYDPVYFTYYFKSKAFRRAVSGTAVGANIQNLSQARLSNHECRIPSIEVQHRIADILSAYDDLIENNQKQIKLLEEAAQRLYKEWFVDLRFPGHENTKIVDGVPEGWNESTVESFGTVITGKTPPTSNKEYYTNGKVPFVTIPDMHNVVYPLKTEKRLTIEGAQTQKNKYIPPNSVMISCIGTVGLVCIATEVCQTNQQINSIILNNEDDLYFFYESMLRMKDLLDGLGSNGATMTNVNKSKLEKLIIISPSKDIVKQYNDVCKPLFESALNLSRKNVYLKNMREALLPKLMSGEVEV
jgi:type I restriction enzyme S subunit